MTLTTAPEGGGLKRMRAPFPDNQISKLPKPTVSMDQWKQLPKDFPPKSTVHDYFVEWHCEGALTRIHHALHAQVRELAGRQPTATTAIVDSQSVKGAEKGGPGSILPATMRARKQRARSVTSPSTRLA